MTTKFKIITGFAVMILLLIAMALSGYSSLKTASQTFSDYRRLTEIDEALNSLGTEINVMSYSVLQFNITKNSEFMTEASKQAASALANLEEAMSLMNPGNEKSSLAAVRESMTTFQDSIRQIRDKYLAAGDHFKKKLLPLIQENDKRLETLAKNAEYAGNTELLSRLYSLGYYLGDVRAAVGVYLVNMSGEAADAMRFNLAEADKQLKEMGGSMTPQSYSELMAAWEAILSQFNPLYTLGREAGEAQANLRKQRETAWEVSGKAGRDANAIAVRRGQEAEASNAAGQATLLGIGIGGTIFGVALAFLIILGLVKVLNALSRYSAAIAGGDFHHSVSIREKGEIGAMLQAIRRIPEVLDSIIAETNGLAVKIANGHFRERFDQSRYSGGFAELSGSINALAASYTTAIDAIPNPIMACDKQHNILFLNTPAQAVLGGNKLQNNCGNLFKAKECGTQSCIGKIAMELSPP